MSGQPEERKALRLIVDVLATDEQFGALTGVVGEAICAAPIMHEGPCRIAWTMSSSTEDYAGEEGSGLTRDAVSFIWEHLEPVDVWPKDEVDKSLGVTS